MMRRVQYCRLSHRQLRVHRVVVYCSWRLQDMTGAVSPFDVQSDTCAVMRLGPLQMQVATSLHDQQLCVCQQRMHAGLKTRTHLWHTDTECGQSRRSVSTHAANPLPKSRSLHNCTCVTSCAGAGGCANASAPPAGSGGGSAAGPSASSAAGAPSPAASACCCACLATATLQMAPLVVLD
jgi:hypothetical protein